MNEISSVSDNRLPPPQIVGLLVAHARCPMAPASVDALRVGAETGIPVPLRHYFAIISRARLYAARAEGRIELPLHHGTACAEAAAVLQLVLGQR